MISDHQTSPFERGIWEPCLADRLKGISFFDGITIHTDKITDPRRDRVLPILEEEQVFMCRAMQSTLRSRPGALVLDVGTGSGVFAIYAAKMGCRVVALDISPRALRVAKENLLLNGLRLCEGPQSPDCGEIKLLLGNLADDDWKASLGGRPEFDFVLLSPPYNPTCPEEISPAYHAEAGLLGQDKFLQQIELAPGLLTQTGVCIGNQMVLLGEKETDEAYWAQRVSSFEPCTVLHRRIISDSIPVSDFLKAQYRHFADKATVSAYVTQQGNLKNSFALEYFEIRRQSLGDPKQSAVAGDLPYPVPPQTWKDRTDLHRWIVEHAAGRISLPGPALFMQDDGLPESSMPRSSESPVSIVMSYVDDWLYKHDAVAPPNGFEDDAFDLILIDTAPYYPTRRGRHSLSQQCVIWASKDYGRDALETFLGLYQLNTVAMQKHRVGPFMHPAFSGRIKNIPWCPIQTSNHDSPGAVSLLLSASEQSQARELIQQIRETRGSETKEFAFSEFETKTEAAVFSTKSDLATLAVQALSEYDKAVLARRKALDSTLKSLKKLSREGYEEDLDVCHETMHCSLDEISSEALGDDTFASCLLGVPANLVTLSPESNDPLKDFRGGAWIYAISKRGLRLGHEHRLFDLARLVQLLLGGAYHGLALPSSRELGKLDANELIPHDLIPQVKILRDKIEARPAEAKILANEFILVLSLFQTNPNSIRPSVSPDIIRLNIITDYAIECAMEKLESRCQDFNRCVRGKISTEKDVRIKQLLIATLARSALRLKTDEIFPEASLLSLKTRHLVILGPLLRVAISQALYHECIFRLENGISCAEEWTPLISVEVSNSKVRYVIINRSSIWFSCTKTKEYAMMQRWLAGLEKTAGVSAIGTQWTVSKQITRDPVNYYESRLVISQHDVNNEHSPAV